MAYVAVFINDTMGKIAARANMGVIHDDAVSNFAV